METPNLQCKNCDGYLKKHFDFCPYCGQKINDKLTLKVLFYNTISNYFSFDARFLKSFFPLMFKPGYLARKYLDGKRLLFLHPAQMYLFISVVFFFILSFSISNQTESLNAEFKRNNKDVQLSEKDSLVNISRDSMARIEVRKALEDNKYLTGMSTKEIDSILGRDDFRKNKVIDSNFGDSSLDSIIATGASDDAIYKHMGIEKDDGWFKRKLYAQALKFYKSRDGGSILKTFYDTIPIALFFLLPLFALILKLLYYRRGPYVDHLVFSFYFFSFLFMTFSIIFAFNLIFDLPFWISFLLLLSTFLYLFLALKRFYQKSWIGSFFKAGVATFTFMAVVLPTALIIIGLYAFLFY